MHPKLVSKAIVCALICLALEGQGAPAPEADPEPAALPSVKADEAERRLPDAAETKTDDSSDEEGDDLSAYLVVLWNSGGISSGVESSDVTSLETELYVAKFLDWGGLSLYLAGSSPLGANDDTWVEANVAFSRELNSEVSLSLGANNYFFPRSEDPPRTYHEVEVSLNYSTEVFEADLSLDQEFGHESNYTYMSASVWREFPLIEDVTVTPIAEITAVLRPGDAYDTSGLETVSFGAEFSYQRKDSTSLYFSAKYEMNVMDDPWSQGMEYVVGMRFEF